MTARDHIRVSPLPPPSSRPVPALSAVFARRQRWIPAFAGMTVEGVWRRRVGWCRTWATGSAGTVEAVRRPAMAGTAIDRGRTARPPPLSGSDVDPARTVRPPPPLSGSDVDRLCTKETPSSPRRRGSR